MTHDDVMTWGYVAVTWPTQQMSEPNSNVDT